MDRLLANPELCGDFRHLPTAFASGEPGVVQGLPCLFHALNEGELHADVVLYLL